MRVLHPVRSQEAPLDAGTWIRPDGSAEAFQVHGLGDGRAVVRVEGDGPALWHLVLDPDGRPERLQVRIRHDGRTVDATLTFFEDEVLIWRRGAAPPSEAIALAPGTRLLWPPIAGRERCLAGLSAAAPARVPCLLIVVVPPDRGGLTARPVELAVARTADGVRLATPGLPEMALAVDAAGRLAGWVEGGAAARRHDPAHPGDTA